MLSCSANPSHCHMETLSCGGAIGKLMPLPRSTLFYAANSSFFDPSSPSPPRTRIRFHQFRLKASRGTGLGFPEQGIDRCVEVGHMLANAAGDVVRGYFRKSFDVIDKDDMSPVTKADRAAEESMISIISDNFPSHAIYGEENGWSSRDNYFDYVWILDPIDGTKSFITGKPLFGTLICLLHKGEPILGFIDQPILRERWIGVKGKTTTLNGHEVSTRTCTDISKAYLYTTSPHFFHGHAEAAFVRVRNKVKTALYGCDCYAYALLSSGYVDLVIETGLKPYDVLALVPVVEGAGGVITDWKGKPLHWEASVDSKAGECFSVVAAGDKNSLHKQAIDLLDWH